MLTDDFFSVFRGEIQARASVFDRTEHEDVRFGEFGRMGNPPELANRPDFLDVARVHIFDFAKFDRLLGGGEIDDVKAAHHFPGLRKGAVGSKASARAIAHAQRPSLTAVKWSKPDRDKNQPGAAGNNPRA